MPGYPSTPEKVCLGLPIPPFQQSAVLLVHVLPIYDEEQKHKVECAYNGPFPFAAPHAATTTTY